MSRQLVAEEIDEQMMQHHSVTDTIDYLQANGYTYSRIDSGFKYWLDNILEVS